MSAGATRHVFRNLFKSRPRDRHECVGFIFSMESVEAYREGAIQWLGDNSELSTKTLESADWNEIYEYFKNG